MLTPTKSKTIRLIDDTSNEQKSTLKFFQNIYKQRQIENYLIHDLANIVIEYCQYFPIIALLPYYDDRVVELWISKTTFFNTSSNQNKLKCVYRFPCGNCSSLSFSHNDRYLIGKGSIINIWDLSNFKTFKNNIEENREIKPIITLRGEYSILSNDNHFLYISYRNYIEVYDFTQNYKHIHTIYGHKNFAQSLAISPDGRWLYSGSFDNTIKIWDCHNDYKCFQTLTDHSSPVMSLCISNDGQYLISGSLSSRVKVWKRKTNKKLLHHFEEKKYDDMICVKTLIGHPHLVDNIDISPCCRYIYSASGNIIQIWDIEQDFKNIHTLTEHTNRIISLSISPCGVYLHSTSLDYTVKIWNCHNNYNCIMTLNQKPSNCTIAWNDFLWL